MVVIAAAHDNVPVTPKALAAVQAAKTVAVPANVPVANAIPRFFYLRCLKCSEEQRRANL
ncbi:hypothetical protein D0A34_19190 [Microcoleus vaginatus PCC 9802]|nr:hypothetical protein D0A34_19190 [Microcoleus vaginatus PCC 9802]